jgi:hypothetical protein
MQSVGLAGSAEEVGGGPSWRAEPGHGWDTETARGGRGDVDGDLRIVTKISDSVRGPNGIRTGKEGKIGWGN